MLQTVLFIAGLLIFLLGIIAFINGLANSNDSRVSLGEVSAFIGAAIVVIIAVLINPELF